jgi:hypothetical protein
MGHRKITEQAFQSAMPRQPQPGQPPPGGNNRLTDEEVRQMLTDLKKG